MNDAKEERDVSDSELNLDDYVHILSHRDRRIWRWYRLKGCVFFGHRFFIPVWRIHRTLVYKARKDKGLPDPFDVFDDFKGPIFTPGTITTSALSDSASKSNT